MVMTPTLATKPATVRLHWALVLLAGLVGGLLFGVNARLWMRFIAIRSEFTWSGTLIIVIGFGIVGFAQSAVYLGRRRAMGRPALTVLRVIGCVLLLPLAFGAGAVAFPTIVLVPLALTQRNWPLWFRWTIGAVAVVPMVVVTKSIFDDLSVGRGAIGAIWFLSIYAILTWAARFSLEPQQDGWVAPVAVRVLGLVVLAPIISVAVVGFLL